MLFVDAEFVGECCAPQVNEKKVLEKERQEEERRLDTIMEIERLKALKMYEDRESRRALDNKLGSQVHSPCPPPRYTSRRSSSIVSSHARICNASTRYPYPSMCMCLPSHLRFMQPLHQSCLSSPLTFTRSSFTSSPLCTNRSLFHSSCPSALPTLLQY